MCQVTAIRPHADVLAVTKQLETLVAAHMDNKRRGCGQLERQLKLEEMIGVRPRTRRTDPSRFLDTVLAMNVEIGVWLDRCDCDSFGVCHVASIDMENFAQVFGDRAVVRVRRHDVAHADPPFLADVGVGYGVPS